MLAKRGEQLLDTGDLLAANRRQDVARADASLRGRTVWREGVHHHAANGHVQLARDLGGELRGLQTEVGMSHAAVLEQRVGDPRGGRCRDREADRDRALLRRDVRDADP